MTAHAVLVWIHILLFVYWLGADLGVFIATIWVKNASRSVAERTVLLQVATAIDLTPRLAFVLMAPVGVTLARDWGLPIGVFGLLAVWLIALVWLCAVLAIARSPQTALGRISARAQFWFLLIGGVVVLASGALLLRDGTIIPSWLGWKIVLYGCIFFVAIGIDLGFRPVPPAFARLLTEGSSEAVEAAIRRPIDTSLAIVSSLYLLLLAISFLGAVKPSL